MHVIHCYSLNIYPMETVINFAFNIYPMELIYAHLIIFEKKQSLIHPIIKGSHRKTILTIFDNFF
jgi:hypothetical protein